MNKFFIKLSLGILITIGFITSCVFDNDMSYPKIIADFIEFNVEGAVSTKIDIEERTVNIVLNEASDINAVKINNMTLSEGAECDTELGDSIIDLSKPYIITLKTFQDYEWTILASQPIDRHINCSNKAEEVLFNLDEKTAVVYVTTSQALNTIEFTSIKLEPEGSEIISTIGKELINEEFKDVEVEVNLPMTLNCALARKFKVLYKGEEIIWTVSVQHIEIEVEIQDVNAWSHHAFIKAAYDGQGRPVIKYKKTSGNEWVSFEDFDYSSTKIETKLDGLEPNTEYDIKLVNGDDESKVINFTTEVAAQIPNMNFDKWNVVYKNEDDKKGVWYPNEEGNNIWGSANPGTASLGNNLTTPVSANLVVSGEGKQAARLLSSTTVGLLASGNIFTGEFIKISGLGAELNWGVPFESRPKALTGYYKYTPKIIDKVKSPYTHLKGLADTCQIVVLLTDWEKPFIINTNDKVFVDYENDEGIIALGMINGSSTNGEYTNFTLDLEYRDLTRKPKYAVIVGASSKYGDYFTGAVGSELLLDEFSFIYE